VGKVTVNARNLRQILRSQEALRLVEQRAHRIASAADSAANAPGGHEVVSEIGRNRARAAVVTATPKAMYKEATVRSLTSSMGAGRG
jgi:hypothetical protein